MGDDKETIGHTEADRWNGEEIHRSDIFSMRQPVDLSQGSGYIQWRYSRLRSIDGRVWPAITRDFDAGGVNPLSEG